MSKSAGLLPAESKDWFPVLKVAMAMHGVLVFFPDAVAENPGVLTKREKCFDTSEAFLENMVLKSESQICWAICRKFDCWFSKSDRQECQENLDVC